jgi:hypothetical protein
MRVIDFSMYFFAWAGSVDSVGGEGREGTYENNRDYRACASNNCMWVAGSTGGTYDQCFQ